jgi:cellulose synthase/poly-beta-1,6-N-acetylglucosamine synthase-like glycosyltransferase
VDVTLLVVDDSSTDGTADIVRSMAASDPRLVLVQAPPLPPGWLGKNHAVWQAAKDSDAKYTLFVDADVRLEPDAIARAITTADETGAGLFTMAPRVLTESFWERTVQGFIALLVFTWLPAKDVNDPKSPKAAGMGPFMLFRTDAYRAIGGHEAVRAEVVEDLKLAEAIKGAGRTLVYRRGPSCASVRMYDSLPAIVRGWGKNFHVALGGAHILAIPAACALVLAYGAAPALVALSAASGNVFALSATALAIVVYEVLRLRARALYALDAPSTLLVWLGTLVTGFILLRSAHAAAFKRPIQWKGRNV